VLLVVVTFMISLLYWAAPNVKQPGFKWITPGGILAVLVWIAASALFALYVAKFSSYNKTYGTLGGVISFLVWLWITNIAVLFGHELDAEIEREREIQAGIPGAEDDIQLPYRSQPDDAPDRPGRFERSH
jgi:membrane protein